MTKMGRGFRNRLADATAQAEAELTVATVREAAKDHDEVVLAAAPTEDPGELPMLTVGGDLEIGEER